jgi:hypothetical protein
VSADVDCAYQQRDALLYSIAGHKLSPASRDGRHEPCARRVRRRAADQGGGNHDDDGGRRARADGLQAGEVSSEEVARTIDGLVAARVDSMLSSSSRLTVGVWSVAERLSESPRNYHQMVGFFLASVEPEDAPERHRAPLMFAGGCAIVLAQVLCVSTVFAGTILTSCKEE